MDWSLTEIKKIVVKALFQSATAYKINSEHTRNCMKLFPVCKVEILQVRVNQLEVFHL